MCPSERRRTRVPDVRATLILLAAVACSASRPKAPVAHEVAPPDPIEALRPRAQLLPYAIDLSTIDGAPVRGHYPLPGRDPAANDDPAVVAAIRSALADDFTVLSIHTNMYGITLDVTPLRKDQELAPDGADARGLARFAALTERISPWCARGPVRWLAPRIERTSAGHESHTGIVQRGISSASDAYGLISVSAGRNSDVETQPPKSWSVWCLSAPVEGLRPAIRDMIRGPALLAHPDLRVTEHATHSLGRFIGPEESCGRWRAQGLACDPISAKLWAPRVELPPTEETRALTEADTRTQVRVMPLVHLGCDGAIRLIVRFDLLAETRIDTRPNGAEIEQIVRHLDMKPIILDLVTGERLPVDLPTAVAWDAASGQGMSTPMPACPKAP